ncbi:hypothetical protein FB45DRAFT_210931 [Roridomyces roridus]|uniref:F-box domain-containing protein n=1 Tax=Roridomyces roridus TaxID=1738132 RepID=A0AAD7FXD6_9AGAR|nr:hypothetical protein FB45DRAFT_210931 [Roridomyces roridus]
MCDSDSGHQNASAVSFLTPPCFAPHLQAPRFPQVYMYPNLAIPELVEHILSYLDPCENRKSLAALARTARVFHIPAIGRLWQSQTDFLTTLRCLPRDLYRLDVVGRDHCRGNAQILRLVRPIEASDWERARLHASHVRKFSYSPTYMGRYCFSYSSIYAVLAFNFMDGGIFRNLTDLDWTGYDSDFFHIRLFLVPKITRITLRCKEQADSVVLSLLPDKCPLLKDVSITFDDGAELSAVASNNITKFILGLCCVESLTIHIPNMVSLMHLARLSTLRYLAVRGLPKALSTVDLVPTPNPFPSLRRLDICEANMTSAIRLLEMCSNSALESFKVENTSHAWVPFPAIASFLAELAKSQHSSLACLDLLGVISDTNITFECLRPALDLVNLVYMKIGFNLGSDLDDAAIAQMAQAWPRTS